MKILAAFMVLVGFVIGAGAVLEFFYYGPEDTAFWVGVFTSPAGLFFALVGVLLWLRGPGIRRLVVLAALVMAAATIAATVLRVMGPPATILGMAGALGALGWSLKRHTPEPIT